MVRLLQLFSSITPAPTIRFNPTMVRLLLALQSPERGHPYMFQSHNGAIAAQLVIVGQFIVWKFQSHNGAIAAQQSRIRRAGQIGVSIPQWCDCCTIRWQNALVRIAVSIPQWCDCCFARLSRFWRVFVVSIPQWCDCCLLSTQKFSRKSFVSIPQWCDCCPAAVGLCCGVACVSIPQWCDCCQGKILGFEGKMGQNERGVAVDLRLPEEPKGVDGK